MRNLGMKIGRPPAKGSKTRAVLLMLLREEGVTRHEAFGVIQSKGTQFSKVIEILVDQKGWDIRPFRLPSHERTGHRHGPRQAWKAVGKYRRNGTYRSLIKEAELLEEVA